MGQGESIECTLTIFRVLSLTEVLGAIQRAMAMHTFPLAHSARSLSEREAQQELKGAAIIECVADACKCLGGKVAFGVGKLGSIE